MAPTSILSRRGRIPLAVSSPGGLARHFRVQVRRPHESTWRLHGSFTAETAALACCRKLEQHGFVTRVVSHVISPAAA